MSEKVNGLMFVTEVLNHPTDLKLLKEMTRHRQKITKEKRSALLMKRLPSTFPCKAEFRTDSIPIEVENMSFGHNATDLVFENVSLSVVQGKLVAIFAAHRAGKTTLLDLLGHSIFPDKGHIYMPAHLVVLHVSHQPVILDLPPWENLMFGRPDPHDPMADPDRVRAILEELHMNTVLKLVEEELSRRPVREPIGRSEYLPKGFNVDRNALLLNGQDHIAGRRGNFEIHTSNEDEDACESFGEELNAEEDECHSPGSADWVKQLTYSERCELHLARALITNPDIMALQRPLHHYSPSAGEQVLRVIKMHILNRGLHLPGDKAQRRPRSVFFSCDSMDHAKEADVIWQVDAGTKTVRDISM